MASTTGKVLVFGVTANELAARVRGWLDEGFLCLGGVRKAGGVLYQEMV